MFYKPEQSSSLLYIYPHFLDFGAGKMILKINSYPKPEGTIGFFGVKY
jgi:hypothetical protein